MGHFFIEDPRQMMDSEGLVEFNVCGTRYQSRRSVIEAQPHSMLAMLLRHPESAQPDGSFFVQRDPLMFRWILYWYSSGILVNEETADVPKEVWDYELDYYALSPPKSAAEQNAKKRIRDESHELAAKAAQHLVKLEQKIDADRENRKKMYCQLLDYMMDGQALKEGVYTGFDFIGCEEDQKMFLYPSSYDTRARVKPSWINNWFDEFAEYCLDVGFVVVKGYYTEMTTSSSYKFSPAKYTTVKTGHSQIHLSFKAA